MSGPPPPYSANSPANPPYAKAPLHRPEADAKVNAPRPQVSYDGQRLHSDGDYANPPSPQPPYQPGQPLHPLGTYDRAPSPSASQLTTGPTRLLHIYHEGFTHRRATIFDSDKTTPLYILDTHPYRTIFSSKPNIEIFHPTNPSQPIATIYFHKMGGDIDITLHGRQISFAKSGFWKSSHEWQSPNLGGERLRWKRDGYWSAGDLVCLDGREQMVARFAISNWSVSKSGKIELGPAVMGGSGHGEAMDEIVVSGIAMHEYCMRQQNASAGVAG
ncbi:hypothetical protein P7C71_g2885, partial [Lecanoromycetidae sp. Uapishka_2]